MNEQQREAWSGRGTLAQLVKELQRQKETKLDFVADARDLMICNGENSLYLAPANTLAQEWLPENGLPITDRALPQFGNRVQPEIPTRFLRDLVRSHASTAASLVNDLLQSQPKRHFIRCLDGKVRALLSNSYRVLDNYDLAFNALEVAKAAGADVIEANLSDTHMRIKFTTKAVWDAIAEKQERGTGSGHEWLGGGRGNWPLPGGSGTVHPLITISNSETGHGGYSIKFGILRAMCVNMAITEEIWGQVHLGGKLETGIYTEETISADSKLIMLKCRDAIHAGFDPERFKKTIAKVNDAQATPVEKPREAVENIVAASGLTDEDHDAILEYFLGDYDRNAYGLSQAVSRYSQDADADKAADLEELAGKLMTGQLAFA